MLGQQAAEKAIKALLELKGKEVPRIHILGDLLKLCSEDFPEIMKFSEDCDRLYSFYQPGRYPGLTVSLLPEDADWALKIARNIVEFVSNRLRKK